MQVKQAKTACLRGPRSLVQFSMLYCEVVSRPDRLRVGRVGATHIWQRLASVGLELHLVADEPRVKSVSKKVKSVDSECHTLRLSGNRWTFVTRSCCCEHGLERWSLRRRPSSVATLAPDGLSTCRTLRMLDVNRGNLRPRSPVMMYYVVVMLWRMLPISSCCCAVEAGCAGARRGIQEGT